MSAVDDTYGMHFKYKHFLNIIVKQCTQTFINTYEL
jgi:hypothetical protein